jgi:hypothetical protein
VSYGVDGFDGQVSFDRGNSLLLTGASALTDERLLDVVAPEDDETAIVITTNLGATEVVDELRRRDADPDQLGVIDCTSRDSDDEDVRIRQLSSPGDLTGMSLEFAKLVDETDEPSQLRVGFASISTALMYAEQQTLFRFLHVFTARIGSGDMFGVFAMDPGMHEDKAYNTIRAVFDAEAEVTDDGITSLRGTGFTR